MRRLFCFIVAAAVLLPVTPVSRGQAASVPAPSIQTCRDRLVNELSQVHDEFRSYVFGSRKDRDGKYTIFTGGYALAERKGIFETKGRLTSELVAPLVESYRVLRCRSLAVCADMAGSFGQQGGNITVRPLGCAAQDLTRYDECYLAGNSSSGPTGGAGMTADTVQLATYCNQLAEDSLTLERRVLQLAVAYDSGYRSMLQLAGMIDRLQQDLPKYVLYPLRDMIGLLGRLHQIPCFIGQCDFPDTSALESSSSSSIVPIE